MGCCCLLKPRNLEELDQDITESKVLITENKQALLLKQQGNQHFKKKAYSNAIRCYKQALLRNPKELVYYTNLALALKANGQLEQAIKVIERIQKQVLNPTLNYNELMSKASVTKARCINLLIKKYIVDNKYTTEQTSEWLRRLEEGMRLLEDAKKYSNVSLEQYFDNSLKIKNYLNKIFKNTFESQVVQFLKEKIRKSKKGLQNQKGWDKIAEYFTNQEVLLQEIQSLYLKRYSRFIEEAEDDEQYLVDPITYEKYKEPVIVPSGITYEQKTLREYFSKGVEYQDPITKMKFDPGQKVIVKNHSLKNYITEMGKLHQIKKEDIELLAC